MEHALVGKANLWYNLKGNFRNFEEFKEEFLNEFYSIPIRVRVKKRWMECKYDSRNEPLQTYFYKQLAQARYFIPKLTDFEANYNIVQQYPMWIRETLSTVNFADTSAVAQVLGNLDAVKDDSDKMQRRNNNYPQKNTELRVNQIKVNEDRNSSQPQRQNNYNNYPRNDGYRRNDDRRNRRSRDETHGPYKRNSRNFTLPDTRYPPPQQFWNSQPSNRQENPSSTSNYRPLNE